jgi:hypothetical protein
VFVYGVATDFCVNAAVMNLLTRKDTQVYVIQDAVAGTDLPNPNDPQSTNVEAKVAAMKAAGAQFIPMVQALKIVGAEVPTAPAKEASPQETTDGTPGNSEAR